MSLLKNTLISLSSSLMRSSLSLSTFRISLVSFSWSRLRLIHCSVHSLLKIQYKITIKIK